MKTLTSAVLGLSLTLASAGLSFGAQNAQTPAPETNPAPTTKKHVKKSKKAAKPATAPAATPSPVPAK